MWRGSSWAATIAAASALAIGVGACGGSSGSSATPTNTVTVQTKTVTAAASNHSQAPASSGSQQGKSGAAGAAGSGGRAGVIAVYQPSSVVSHSGATTVLTSPDSVDKIGSFYGGVLADAGWQIRSSSKSAYSANFSAHRDGEGVSISVYPRGSGSGITISKHPE